LGEPLLAQGYRTGDYVTSTDLYYDLLGGADKTSDDYADISSNLLLSSDRLDFSKSLVPKIKRTSSISVEALESRPIAPLLFNHPSFKAAPSDTAPNKPNSVKIESPKKPKRLPKGITWDPINSQPPKELDLERWSPMKHRSYYVPPVEITSSKSKAAKRRKKLVKEREQLSTQGAAETSKTSGGISGSGGRTKKKGKK